MTCEDADDGFKPTCGSIDELNFRTSPDVWGYFSVKSGGGIHEFSDSQVRAFDAALNRPTWRHAEWLSVEPSNLECASTVLHQLEAPSWPVHAFMRRFTISLHTHFPLQRCRG